MYPVSPCARCVCGFLATYVRTCLSCFISLYISFSDKTCVCVYVCVCVCV